MHPFLALAFVVIPMAAVFLMVRELRLMVERFLPQAIRRPIRKLKR